MGKLFNKINSVQVIGTDMIDELFLIIIPLLEQKFLNIKKFSEISHYLEWCGVYFISNCFTWNTNAYNLESSNKLKILEVAEYRQMNI